MAQLSLEKPMPFRSNALPGEEHDHGDGSDTDGKARGPQYDCAGESHGWGVCVGESHWGGGCRESRALGRLDKLGTHIAYRYVHRDLVYTYDFSLLLSFCMVVQGRRCTCVGRRSWSVSRLGYSTFRLKNMSLRLTELLNPTTVVGITSSFYLFFFAMCLGFWYL